MVDVLNHSEFRAGRTYTDFIEKNMPDWSIDVEPALELAAAVASAAILRGTKSTVSAGREKKISPWQAIGPWEIGIRIVE